MYLPRTLKIHLKYSEGCWRAHLESNSLRRLNMESQIQKIKPALNRILIAKIPKLEYLSPVTNLGIKSRNIELIKTVLEELVNHY